MTKSLQTQPLTGPVDNFHPLKDMIDDLLVSILTLGAC